jgi:NAD(P)-dependent dehydrogenase (short-subunit alcohol dehydrogenase family)
VARWLVTGSAGHLGEALVRVLRERGETVLGFDLKPSAHTEIVASLIDRDQMAPAVTGVDHVLHTATLHKRTSLLTLARTSSTSTSPAPSPSSRPPPRLRCAAWCHLEHQRVRSRAHPRSR